MLSMNELPRVDAEALEWDLVDSEYLTYWKDQPFTGVAVEHFPDGRLMSEVHYRDGREHGSSRGWHPSGLLRDETDMWRGVVNGYERHWDEQGRLVSESVSELGVEVCARAWSAQGELSKDWIIGPSDWRFNRLRYLRQHFGFFACKEL